MASTNKTPNLELSQFLGTDKPSWLGDYNGDMLKIDTGVETALTNAAAADTASKANTEQIATLKENVTELTTTTTNQGTAITTLQTGLNATNTTVGQNKTAINSLNTLTTPTYQSFQGLRVYSYTLSNPSNRILLGTITFALKTVSHVNSYYGSAGNLNGTTSGESGIMITGFPTNIPFSPQYGVAGYIVAAGALKLIIDIHKDENGNLIFSIDSNIPTSTSITSINFSFVQIQ